MVQGTSRELTDAELVGIAGGTEGDKAKDQQNQLQETNDFSKKAQDFFSAYIDLLRSMNSKIDQ